MLLKVKRVSTFKEAQKIPKSVVRFLFSLGCSPLWPIAKQRGAMNPIPATSKTSFDRNWFLLVNHPHCGPFFGASAMENESNSRYKGVIRNGYSFLCSKLNAIRGMTAEDGSIYD